MKTRIAILSFSDGRPRVHAGLLPVIKKHEANIAAALEGLGAQPVAGEDVIHTPRMAVREAKRLLGLDVAAVVFNIPVFAFPNLSVITADILQKPIAICSPGEPGLPGMGGMLAAGGALEQTGHFQTRIWGSLARGDARRDLAVFVRAAGARHALRGQVYGQIGGRSIGMLTGVATGAAEWHRVFGVDCDHVDESEILRLAEKVPARERERIVTWLERQCGGVAYASGTKLTRQTLQRQAACATAGKRIIREHEFDFISIKCHYDLSEYYCTQCLSAAFLPSCCDWDGVREPVACACEADGDGALTMQIMQLITGLPALFMDLRHYDAAQRRWTFCNCGGMSVFYAGREQDSKKNLRKLKLVPVIPKYAGDGCHVRYLGAPGPLTCARLMHDAQGLCLMVFRAEALRAKKQWLGASCPAWPHVFATVPDDALEILQMLHANHIHAVAGDCVAELALFARLLGIRVVTPQTSAPGIKRRG